METIRIFCDECNKENHRPSIDLKVTDYNEILGQLNLNFITKVVTNYGCRACLLNIDEIKEFVKNNLHLEFLRGPYVGVDEIANLTYIDTFNVFRFSARQISKMNVHYSWNSITFKEFCDDVKVGSVICEDIHFPINWKNINEYFATNNYTLERIICDCNMFRGYEKYIVNKLTFTKRAIKNTD